MAEGEKPDRITIVTGEPIRRTATGRLGFTKSRSRDKSQDRSDIQSVYDEAFEAPRESDFRHRQIYKGWPLLLLAYQSTGVIYGDIGTSPIYVFSSTFTQPPTFDDLLGSLSIIIWTLTIIVTIKYVVVVLNADNEGQGGTFALYSLLTRYSRIGTATDPNKENLIRIERYQSTDISPGNRSVRNVLERYKAARFAFGLLACFGVSLIMSDGVLTPAQSILGAVQGLNVVAPKLGQGAIIGITCAILVFLFAIQPFGVGRISIAFAPIVIIWLLFNFCFGVYNLAHHDHSVLKAFSPYFAGLYFVRNKTEGWKSLGGMLLAFTGVEALFADLGAFSKRAIQLSWLCLAYPCLLMAYIGQAAYIADNPEAYSNPFFNAAPPGTFWPAFIISILAAIVASQALITSTFQLLFQCINMSYFPPISYRYTSTRHHSQIFIGMANWLLMIGTIVVTCAFRDTTKLGNAYGVCVILDSVVTTSLVSLVAIIVWRIRWWIVLPLWLTEATFEGLYLTSALTKVPDGAWFTLCLAVVLATIFTTWRFGKEKQWTVERKGRLRLNRLVSKGTEGELKLNPGLGGREIITTRGIGIFFDKPGGDFVPVVYEEFVRKFEAQPEVQVFLHLRATTVPFVPQDERYAVTRTGLPNCYRMILRFGYSEPAVSPQIGRIVYDEVKKYIMSMGRRPAPTEHDDDHDRREFTRADNSDSAPRTPAVDEDKKDDSTPAISDGKPGPSSKAGSLAEGDILDLDKQIQDRLLTLESAYRSQTIYMLGKENLKLPDSGMNIFKRGLLAAYLWMRDSTGDKVGAFKIPYNKMVEVGFIKEL